MSKSKWRQGWNDEIRFWREFVDSERFKTNWIGTGDNPELDDENVRRFLLKVVHDQTPLPLRILDVGSGPVSILSKFVRSFPCVLTAADPLALDYAHITLGQDLRGAVQPIACEGERLSDVFGPETYDVVHIRNALDHSYSPMRVVAEMAKVCRRGGYLIIYGFAHEAEREGYQGFHQWNLDADPRSKGITLYRHALNRSVTGAYADFLRPVYVEKRKTVKESEWVVAMLHKTAPVPEDIESELRVLEKAPSSSGRLKAAIIKRARGVVGTGGAVVAPNVPVSRNEHLAETGADELSFEVPHDLDAQRFAEPALFPTLWWDKSKQGQGVILSKLGDDLWGTWTAYDENGACTWLLFKGRLDGERLDADLLRYTGPPLGKPWDAAQVKCEMAGTVRLRIKSKLSVILEYAVTGHQGLLELTPFR